MTEMHSGKGLLPHGSDDEIAAAVGADPDQIEFTNRYLLALGSLRNWEQGRSEPDQAAKVLLAAIPTDSGGVAAAATNAGGPSFLAAGRQRAARPSPRLAERNMIL